MMNSSEVSSVINSAQNTSKEVLDSVKEFDLEFMKKMEYAGPYQNEKIKSAVVVEQLFELMDRAKEWDFGDSWNILEHEATGIVIKIEVRVEKAYVYEPKYISLNHKEKAKLYERATKLKNHLKNFKRAELFDQMDDYLTEHS